MNSGDAFFFNDRNLDPHMWFVISDTTLDSEWVIIANVTSWDDTKDQACIIEEGDHPFVKKKTCVNYNDAKLIKNEFLDAQISKGTIKYTAPISPSLLSRIRLSAANSRKMQTGIWDFLEKQLEIEF